MLGGAALRLMLCSMVLSGCGTDALITGDEVSSSSGALHTVVPAGWSVDYTFRLREPAGEGVAVSSDGVARITVYASVTALEDRLGDDPRRSDLYSFSLIQHNLREMDSFWLGDGCVSEAIRPIEGAGFYGSAERLRDCEGDWDSEVRATLVDAGRTTVVWVTVAADGDEALRLASEVVGNLVVDREAVPKRVAVSTTIPD